MLARIIVALLVVGCASTKSTMTRHGTHYFPTSNAEILFQDPTVPFVVVAVVETEGKKSSYTAMLKRLQEEAMAIGAHAVIVASPESKRKGWKGWSDTTLKGIAIRYQTTAKTTE